MFIYILAVMPKVFNSKNLETNICKYFAHRGLHNNIDVPENSYLAFYLAVKNNYGIELDIHLTKDNIPVVFHDYSLLRMCGSNLKIENLTLKELSNYTLLNTNEHIPTLEEVLDLVNGKTPLIIELKLRSTNLSLCSYTQELLNDYKGLYCIESFNPLALLWYKKHYPNIIRGQLSTTFLKEDNDSSVICNFLLQNLLFNFITKPDFIAFNHKTPKLLVLRLCRSLYKVPLLAWTIESSNELEKAYEFFDAYIFEGFMPKKQAN